MAATSETFPASRHRTKRKSLTVALVLAVALIGIGFRALSLAGGIAKGEVMIATGNHDGAQWELFGMRNGSRVCLDLRLEPAMGGACAISTPISQPLQMMPGTSTEFPDAYIAGAVSDEVIDVDVLLDNGSTLRAEIFESSQLGQASHYFLVFVPHEIGGLVRAHGNNGIVDDQRFKGLADLAE